MHVNVVLLFGGTGEEYEISLRSAAAVLLAFPYGYTVFPVGIDRAGGWYLTDASPEAIAQDAWQEGARPILLDPVGGALLVDGEPIPADAVLPILHGGFFEGGGAAAACRLLSLPCVGCPPLAGALALDKVMAKRLAASEGIAVARYQTVRRADLSDPTLPARLAEALGLPLFCKPASGGSSVGASLVSTREEIPAALEAALSVDSRALCEEYIEGTEVELALLEDGDRLLGHEVGEIDTHAAFYDYHAKYRDRTSRVFIPARVSSASRAAVRAAGRSLFYLLGCRGLARVDFFVRPTGEIVFNEINTMPGFTDISMFPMLLRPLGLTLGDVVEILVKNAIL